MLKNSRTSTTTKLILLLMKFCQCKKFFVFVKKFLSMFKNSLFREIIFLELPKYSWNLKILSIIEKLKDWKILLKIVKKLAHIFPGEVEKIGTPLPHLHAKLKNWHVKLKNWLFWYVYYVDQFDNPVLLRVLQSFFLLIL